MNRLNLGNFWIYQSRETWTKMFAGKKLFLAIWFLIISCAATFGVAQFGVLPTAIWSTFVFFVGQGYKPNPHKSYEELGMFLLLVGTFISGSIATLILLANTIVKAVM